MGGGRRRQETTKIQGETRGMSSCMGGAGRPSTEELDQKRRYAKWEVAITFLITVGVNQAARK
jgi:hypothetical protein